MMYRSMFSDSFDSSVLNDAFFKYIYPWYCPGNTATARFRECKLPIPVPDTPMSSVRFALNVYSYSGHTGLPLRVYPTAGKGICIASVPYPTGSVSSVRICTGTRQFSMFYQTSIPVADSFVRSEYLVFRTRHARTVQNTTLAPQHVTSTT